MAPVSDIDPVVPAKHPAVELLVDYAAGAMFEAEALTIALHLDACPSCRQAADLAFATGGVLLNEIDPAYVPLALLQVTLQEIDEHAPAGAAGKPAGTVPAYARQWPPRLRAHLADRWPRRWRLMPAGFRGLRIPTEGDAARLWMIKIPGGKGPPRHRHREVEWTLVVEGGFRDESGRYAPGDFCYMGKGDVHSVMADPEGCTCLIVTRINPEYLTLKGRLAAPLIRL